MRLIYPERDLMIRLAEQHVSRSISYLWSLLWYHCICHVLAKINAQTFRVCKGRKNSYHLSLKWNIIKQGGKMHFFFLAGRYTER